jgi:hypothetical protein
MTAQAVRKTTEVWIREAQDEAADWPTSTLDAVVEAKPADLDRVPAWAWATAVACARGADETPEQTADRLASYVRVYRERYGSILPVKALSKTKPVEATA